MNYNFITHISIPDCKADGCGFDSNSGKLIIPFPRSDSKIKCGVESHPPKRNVTNIGWKVVNGVF